jgi:hypothetical protein
VAGRREERRLETRYATEPSGLARA